MPFPPLFSETHNSGNGSPPLLHLVPDGQSDTNFLTVLEKSPYLDRFSITGAAHGLISILVRPDMNPDLFPRMQAW